MKTAYETPSFSIAEYQVKEGFLLSGDMTTTTTTPISYDPTDGWSPIKPPKT